MNYTGNLYGKIGRKYVPLRLTSEDVDRMQRERDSLAIRVSEGIADGRTWVRDIIEERNRLRTALEKIRDEFPTYGETERIAAAALSHENAPSFPPATPGDRHD